MKTRMTIAIVMLVAIGGTYAWGSSPPWLGDGHYTFDDSDPLFAHGTITDTATVDITGGGFSMLHARLDSTVNMSGGIAGSIDAYNSSRVNLSGGQVTASIGAWDNSLMTLYVETYQYHPIGSQSYDGYYTGSWGYGRGEFDIWLDTGTLPNVRVEVIPEPLTVGLLGLGALAMRMNKNNSSLCQGERL